MPIKASSKPNLVDRSQQGMSVRAAFKPSRVRGIGRVCRLRLHPDQTWLTSLGRVCRLRLHPDRAKELQENSASTLRKTPPPNLPSRVRKECMTLFNSAVIKLEVCGIPCPRYSFSRKPFQVISSPLCDFSDSERSLPVERELPFAFSRIAAHSPDEVFFLEAPQPNF